MWVYDNLEVMTTGVTNKLWLDYVVADPTFCLKDFNESNCVVTDPKIDKFDFWDTVPRFSCKNSLIDGNNY